MRYILALITVIPFWLSAQTVENIHTHQNGSKIDIHYNIKNSGNSQVFKVSIFCYVNNDRTIELKSISGDVGDNVVGGKVSYTATWDVLQDVESLSSAEFTVRIELVNAEQEEETANTATLALWSLNLNSEPTFTPFGVRLAYGNVWGTYFAARMGINGYKQYGNDVSDEALYSFTVGATRQLTQKNNLNLMAYAGAGIAQWGNYEYTETQMIEGNSDNGFQSVVVNTNVNGDADKGMEFEYGLIAVYHKLVLTGGLAHNSAANTFQSAFVFGIGFTF